MTNIDINITAGLEKKVYLITLGKGKLALNLAFEAVSGSPVRFLKETNTQQHPGHQPLSLYGSYESVLDKKEFGRLTIFHWRRKEHYALCHIIINEPFENTSLEKGPKTTLIPISNIEFIRITHRRYQLNNNNPDINDLILKNPRVENPHEWTRRKLSITIGPSDATLHVTIPSLDPLDKKSKSDEYVRIEQQEIFD